jgi:hypothetical protein
MHEFIFRRRFSLEANNQSWGEDEARARLLVAGLNFNASSKGSSVKLLIFEIYFSHLP